MASEKCGMPTLPLSNKPERDVGIRQAASAKTGAHPSHKPPALPSSRDGAPLLASAAASPARSNASTAVPPTPWRPVPSFGRGSLHGVHRASCPGRVVLPSRHAPARPVADLNTRRRGQKPPATTTPHTRRPPVSRISHMGCSSHTATERRDTPALLRCFRILRPPPPDDNSVRTQRRTHELRARPSRLPTHAARQHAILKRHQQQRPTLASEPL